MTCADVLAELEQLGTDKVRDMNCRSGINIPQFGTKMGDVRAIAKRIKSDPELAKELWATGKFEAMMVATLIMKPKQLSAQEVEALVRSVPHAQVADWLNTNVVKLHPAKEALRQKWITEKEGFAARAGWSLTTELVNSGGEGLDLSALLDRIEAEMAGAPEEVRWLMNYCLAAIGIKFAEHRSHAIAIGEALGVYRDYPCSKGCTSPFAPIWINAMVSRE